MSDPFIKAEHVQGSPAWLEMRKNYIGASEAASVMGEDPWRTPLQLWEQKVGVAAPPQQNWAMKRGTEMEPLALKSFQNDSGLEMYPQIVYHPHKKFMMASLDGLTLSGDISVEAKCPGAKAHAMALAGIVPPYYIPQLQHQLACLCHEMLWYWSFDGEKGVGIEVRRDDVYIEQLILAEEVFWGHVIDITPPDPTDRDYEPRESPVWATIGQRIKQIDDIIDPLKRERESLRQTLIADADGKSCKGGGVSLGRSFPRGRVNYDIIPELVDVDLELYRKKAKETWTLRREK